MFSFQREEKPHPHKVFGWRKPMKRKARPRHTAAEQAHLDAVQALGCLVCRGVAEIHHVRSLRGVRIRRNHMLVLLLCPTHHRTGPEGVAFHAGSREWQRIHGSEESLLAVVDQRLQEVA
jgi:hypothetical protein